MPTPPRSDLFAPKDRLFLGVLTVIGLFVGLKGIFNYGYLGQDFKYHFDHIVSFPESFSYQLTNPPGLYWLGSVLWHHVSSGHFLEVLALLFLVSNAIALWIIYGLLWQSMAHRPLRYAAAAFITLVPFRVIQSVVIAADAFTLPIFALTAFCALRLVENPRHVFSWIGISLGLAVGLLCKYTLVGVLPPLALILAIALVRQLPPAQRLRWGMIGTLALALPAGVFLLEMRESRRVSGASTSGHWLPKGQPSVMRWHDILTLKKSDVATLSAPEYMRGEIYQVRKYSYAALLHLTAVTDSQNFFQKPPAAISTNWDRRYQDGIDRTRSAHSQTLQTWSVRWCLPFSILAVVGTLFCGVLSAQSLWSRKPLLPNATVVITALAVGYYALILFSLPRVNDPYIAGYWVPRLVLPALVVFFSLGFVLLDFICQRLAHRPPMLKIILSLISSYTLVACLLFIGFLT